MTLNSYVAEKRKEIFEDLQARREPREGEFSRDILKEALVKDQPQIGTTRFEPGAVVLEFIYPDARTTATVLSVKLTPPERIIFMPVPTWVVESIWQGEIDGSFHFETEAAELLAAYANLLMDEANAPLFDRKVPTHRE